MCSQLRARISIYIWVYAWTTMWRIKGYDAYISKCIQGHSNEQQIHTPWGQTDGSWASEALLYVTIQMFPGECQSTWLDISDLDSSKLSPILRLSAHIPVTVIIGLKQRRNTDSYSCFKWHRIFYKIHSCWSFLPVLYVAMGRVGSLFPHSNCHEATDRVSSK